MSLHANQLRNPAVGAPEGINELVYGPDSVHSRLYSHRVIDFNASIPERTVLTNVEILPLMARKSTAQSDIEDESQRSVEVPVADIDAIFGRLQLLADTDGLSLTKATENLGITSERLFNHKTRKSIPSMDILRRFKRKYGVTIDWIVEGDESGLSRQARDAILGL